MKAWRKVQVIGFKSEFRNQHDKHGTRLTLLGSIILNAPLIFHHVFIALMALIGFLGSCHPTLVFWVDDQDTKFPIRFLGSFSLHYFLVARNFFRILLVTLHWFLVSCHPTLVFGGCTAADQDATFPIRFF